jgi:hypothetical protein
MEGPQLDSIMESRSPHIESLALQSLIPVPVPASIRRHFSVRFSQHHFNIFLPNMDEINEKAARFVSEGSLKNLTEREAEWLAAQKALEEERASKAQLNRERDGKTLYEILQENKGICLLKSWSTCELFKVEY